MTNQPLPPDEDRFVALVQRAIRDNWLTNFGQLHDEFAQSLREYLRCEHVLPVTNGTFGLLTALRALDVRGEVITTPFTFPATPHVLFNLSGIRPVFVDICEDDFGIDPESVRKAITPETSAIVAVHAYGFPCRIAALEQIAADYDLKLIFDAAPAFGVEYQGRSVASFGDASVFSFHATKVFNTAEGGAIVCRDRETYDKCKLFINFGISGEESIECVGLNGKMDEIRAALGLAGLNTVNESIVARRKVVECYLEHFAGSKFENVAVCREIFESDAHRLNYAYFPMLVTPHKGISRDTLYDALRERGIVARKYYYPTVLDHPVYDQEEKRIENVDRASEASRKVLCLPVNAHFSEEDCSRILNEFGGCIIDLSGKQQWKKLTA